MKKEYFAPQTLVVRTETEQLLSGSGIQSNYDIDYGGIDEDGTKEPAARRQNVAWDDDEDDEQ